MTPKPSLLAAALVCFAVVAHPATQGGGTPSIDDVIGLKRVGTPAISPDGRLVAYTVREARWEDDSYDTGIWIGDTTNGKTWQATYGAKSSLAPEWSRDGRWLAFISDRDGKRQIYRMMMGGGEAERLTSSDEGVSAFEWSPDGRSIAFTEPDPPDGAVKAREKRWGDVRFEDQDPRYIHLHVIDLDTGRVRRLTSGPFVVGSFDWSPGGSFIAFDHRMTSDAAEGGSADISTVNVATGERQVVVAQYGPDTTPRWSPDGQQIAFLSAMARPDFYYQNAAIAVVRPGSMTVTPITEGFDENPSLVAWTPAGVFVSAAQRTWAYLYSIDPATRRATRHAPATDWIGSAFSVTPDGTKAAFIAAGPQAFPDVWTAPLATMTATRVSDTAAQVAAWPDYTREVFRWKSQDGTDVEGVLHKPADFQAGRRYPLLVVIHGGPAAVSRPMPYSNYVGYYPIDAFLARGAVVLEPNYRGSAGYGEKFRALNVRNLGIGDAWDVLSGIDALVAQGIADGSRVGCMGWSQGGYISAFLATKYSARFRAASVGAGISDWMTYYVNTDIHPFTLQYLQATPWDDPKIYADTSPITYIKDARTPTLIQHGSDDRRVPIPNAYELYQGLKDQHVTVQMAVFEGFGHGLTTPRAHRAAMQQNYDWFLRYVIAAGGGR